MSDHSETRRKFIKATAYTAPVILTLKAAPTFAKSGSMPVHKHCRHEGRHGKSYYRGHGQRGHRYGQR